MGSEVTDTATAIPPASCSLRYLCTLGFYIPVIFTKQFSETENFHLAFKKDIAVTVITNFSDFSLSLVGLWKIQ